MDPIPCLHLHSTYLVVSCGWKGLTGDSWEPQLPSPPRGFKCLVLGYSTLTRYYHYSFSLDITIYLFSVCVFVCETDEKRLLYY